MQIILNNEINNINNNNNKRNEIGTGKKVPSVLSRFRVYQICRENLFDILTNNNDPDKLDGLSVKLNTHTHFYTYLIF